MNAIQYYDINAIKVQQRKRPLGNVRELAQSISDVGLLNPISIKADGTLIAGYHRLEACKLLDWEEIPVIVQNLDTLQAELAEIDENLYRNELTAYEQGKHLLRRNEILEAKGLRAKVGFNGNQYTTKVGGDTVSPPTKTTADLAQDIGLSERDAQRRMQVARNIAPDVAEIIEATPIADSITQLLDLARMKPEQQRTVAATIASGKAETITEAKRELKEQEREQKRERNRELVTAVPLPATATAGQRFQTIVIDPPWDWGDEGDVDQFGRARPTYNTMPFDDILALPVGELSATNAHIYLWITNRSLPKGFQLLDAWGFRYVTCITWCKPSIGMGNYFRGSTEQLLFGVRGSLPLLRRDVGTWFEAPRGSKHSSKPTAFYELVESCSPGPWLEMFARLVRNGWVSWGAEACTISE